MSEEHSAADVGYELSVQQELLWTTDPSGTALRAQVTLELGPAVAEADVRSALDAVVGRHESLRTTFSRPAGLRLPLQVVCDHLPPAWSVVELPEAGDPAAALTDLAAAEARVELDAVAGPLMRAVLVRQGGDRNTLLLTAAATVADGRSLLVAADEVRSALLGRSGEAEPVQYADFAAWQREQLADAPTPPASAPPPVVGLPFAGSSTPAGSHPRVGVAASFAGVELPAGATSAEGWLAAWVLLTARLSGEQDLAVGVLDPGRHSAELAGAVGPYAGVLPVHCTVALDQTFSTLVADVVAARDAAVAAAALAPPRGLPPLPFAYAAEPVGILAGHPQPFQVRLVVTGDSVELEHDPGAVGAEEADRVTAALARLVADIAAFPQRAVGRLAVLTAAEERLLRDVNRTEAPVPATGVHTLIEEQAARTPDGTAVVGADRSLTYAELDAAANRLANLLRARGVTAGTPVALCLERTSALVAAILAVLKAGGAYVPLHPEHPKARLAFQLADSGAPVVLTTPSLRPVLPDTTSEVLELDQDLTLLAGHPATAPPPLTGPEDVAYLIYTSGSTGTPKAVAVRHGGLTNYTTAIVRRFDLGARPQSFALVTTVSTDLGNTCLFPSLVSGGCLHLVPVDAAVDGAAYARYAAAAPVDVLKITPSHLGALLSAGGAGVLPRRLLVLGGESCPWSLVDRVRDLGTCAIANHYGPTETTVGSLVHDVAAHDVAAQGPRLSRTVPIGRPVANTRVHVLDRQRTPVPVGAPGELYIGGAGLARGYWNDPARTAESFRPDPFSPEPENRLYRSGDLARFLPDGSLEFLGRIDDQVKIRGFRVEPGEVEHALAGSSRVAQTAVVAVSDLAGGVRLVAYVVGAHGRLAAADVEQLRRELADRVPGHMVPTGWVPLEALPLGLNGKLDRRALPSPDKALGDDATVSVAPRTETERRLADIWAAVLQVDRVGVTDDFFGLGGHSLLATQVIARVRSTFGVQLPLPSLFLAPTVAGLAELLEERLVPPAPVEQDLAEMIAEIEGMSEEEAERLLRLEAERSE